MIKNLCSYFPEKKEISIHLSLIIGVLGERVVVEKSKLMESGGNYWNILISFKAILGTFS